MKDVRFFPLFVVLLFLSLQIGAEQLGYKSPLGGGAVAPSGDSTGTIDTFRIQAACANTNTNPVGGLTGGDYYIKATLVCATLGGVVAPALGWYDYLGQISPVRIIGVNGSPWTNNAMLKCAPAIGTSGQNNCGYSNFQVIPPPGVDGIDFGGAYGARFINVDIGGGAHVHRHGYVNSTGLTNEVYWYGGHLAGGTGCGIKDSSGGLTDSSMIGMNISDYQDCGIELGPGSGLIGINSGRIEDQFSGPAIRLAASCLSHIGVTQVSFDNNLGELVIGDNCNYVNFSNNVTSNEHASGSIEFVSNSGDFTSSGNTWTAYPAAAYIMDDTTKVVSGSWQTPRYGGWSFANASTWQAMGPFADGGSGFSAQNYLNVQSNLGWGLQRFTVLGTTGNSTITNNIGIDPFFGQQFAAGWRETATTAQHYLGITPLGFALENLTYTISAVVEPVGTNRFLALVLSDNTSTNLAKKYFDTTTCQPSGADSVTGSATVVSSGGNKINTGKCQVWAAMNLSVSASAGNLFFQMSTSNSSAGDSYLGLTNSGMNISYPSLMRNIIPINGVPY